VQLISNNIAVRDTNIDAFSTTSSFPFNTDGFDVTETNIAITDSVIFNGDDAIAVQSGSHVLFQHGTIGYQTYGMSIGSLGQGQATYANVSSITFTNIAAANAVHAARFKSWQGGPGTRAKHLLAPHPRLQRLVPGVRGAGLHEPGLGADTARERDRGRASEQFERRHARFHLGRFFRDD
jgi:hypothetical protein